AVRQPSASGRRPARVCGTDRLPAPVWPLPRSALLPGGHLVSPESGSAGRSRWPSALGTAAAARRRASSSGAAVGHPGSRTVARQLSGSWLVVLRALPAAVPGRGQSGLYSFQRTGERNANTVHATLDVPAFTAQTGREQGLLIPEGHHEQPQPS